MKSRFLFLMLTVLLSSCGGSDNNSDNTSTAQTPALPANSGQLLDLTSKSMQNRTAYIPPQCYTKTIDAQNQAHNPCYSCHISSEEPNYINDGDLQLGYTFPEYANDNHWYNLFEDRSQAVAAIPDDAMLAYVRKSNYLDDQGGIMLANILENVPGGWDFTRDGNWNGFTPDCHFNFDDEGFDLDPSGAMTGWRAFGYAPFLGTFWPTNGSTDDVLIRLPQAFRQNENGQTDNTIYKINLAIVEAMIKRADVAITPVDEVSLGVDLDKDGQLLTATRITYDWAPLQGRQMSYVGMAQLEQLAGRAHLAAGLFPEGTEFLHSVRYIDIDENNRIKLAPRMKELRYAKKIGWHSYAELEEAALGEIKEESDFPDRTAEYAGDVERGMSNKQGWVYQGFIEDANGELRPQTYEETVFCMGCHGTVGATDDGIYSFRRKFPSNSFQQGWYHWSQKDLVGIPEPVRADGQPEYAWYLQQNGAGDEFRANEEVRQKFFDANGNLLTDALEKLSTDISYLLYPSPQRALNLNKAYKLIVEEQSFVAGRDANVMPMENVHETVEKDQSTGILEAVSGPYDSGATVMAF